MTKTAPGVKIRQRLVHVAPLIHVALGHVGGGEFAARERLVGLSRDVEGVGDADLRLPSLRYRIAEVDGLLGGDMGTDQRGIVIPTVAANMYGLCWIGGIELRRSEGLWRSEGPWRSEGCQLQAMVRRRRRRRWRRRSRRIRTPQAMIDSRPCIDCIIISFVSKEAVDDGSDTRALDFIGGLLLLRRESLGVGFLPLTPCALVDEFNCTNFLL